MTIKEKVGSLKGIGPKKEEALKNAGIETLEDLIYFFPRSYEDRRTVSTLRDAELYKDVLIEAKVVGKRFSGHPYKKNAPLTLMIEDDTGSADVVFFNGRFLNKLFQVNDSYSFFGRITMNFAKKQMIHPQFARLGSKDDIRGILPVYPVIPGFSQNEIRKIEKSLIPLYSEIEEWMPEEVVKENRLCDPAYALNNLHFPSEGRKVLEGKFRMVFEELFTLEAGLISIRQSDKRSDKAVSFSCKAGDEFAMSLPFDLTEGQKEAWESIKADLEGNKRMNRLLQGDVGSGKTVLAEMAMLSAAKNGLQSVIMAPTELLAKQHLESFTRDLEPLGVRVGLLISSISASEKRRIIEDLGEGNIDILIATHAVLEEKVVFKNLGLVITDEQHRFGVSQRKRLSSKNEDANVLVMTATPIPRTLAVILYGDLDVSQVRTMPKGRKPVKTTMVRPEERDRMYNFLKSEIEKGRQAYVVAPLISESEKIDARSADEVYEELLKKYPMLNIALVHGAMKADEKNGIMESFVRGDIDILVSTVVIEVGINVPNSSVMVIENAERFGLAQLHQLRGRVGRGSDESYCFLVTDSTGDIAVERSKIMCSTSSGFEIAEEDLKLRGPGEVFGTRQHGLPQLEISDLVRHADVLEKAAKAAKKVVEDDPNLEKEENKKLKDRVKKLYGDSISLDL